ncbi:MAG: SGNH/GDSL hydrolase family protein [Burkholderiales bacterium]|nr:SGNH/GDSL hydrolase family protein [Burkholderiales bacterium]
MSKPTPAKVLFPAEIDTTVAETAPSSYSQLIFAEGDSWFSFGSWRLRNLLQQLRFSKSTMIVTLALPGDTITRMSNMTGKNKALDMMLTLQHGYAWNAILLSGGGNDVIDDAKKIIVSPTGGKSKASHYIDKAALADSLDAVEKAYTAVIKMRDRPESPSPGAPIIVHTYDRATPRNSPAQFLNIKRGPWLFNAMNHAGVPPALWNEVADHVMGALADRLVKLGSTLPNFHVVDTRGTLVRAASGSTGTSNDWENEIHPSDDGYEKIAQPYGVEVNKRLAGPAAAGGRGAMHSPRAGAAAKRGKGK